MVMVAQLLDPLPDPLHEVVTTGTVVTVHPEPLGPQVLVGDGVTVVGVGVENDVLMMVSVVHDAVSHFVVVIVEVIGTGVSVLVVVSVVHGSSVLVVVVFVVVHGLSE